MCTVLLLWIPVFERETDMDNKRHHYSCRCNDCVRQRNARRRRSADRHTDEGNPLPAGAMWYEVPGDYPVRYQDDVSPSASERQFEQTARKWLEDAITAQQSDGPQFPADYGNKDDAQPPADTVPELPRLEPPIHYQRDDMEREQEQLREFRRQQEERQRDWEQRRDQIRTEQDANERTVTEKPDGGMDGPPSGDDSAPVAAEPVPPAVPMPSTTPGSRSRRNILAPLVVSFVLLTVVVGVGMLVAYVVLSSSSGMAAPEVVEPTPDLEATVAAAVAMIPALLTPSPVAQPRTDNPSDTAPIATVPSNAPQLPQPPAANTLAATQEPDGLPEIACPDCTVPDPPADSYVEWVRDPKVLESGILSFRARIDEEANFVVAGPSCGFANLTLTDDSDAFYGAIIPRSMAVVCDTRLGDWIANQYYYIDNLLTVRLQINPAAALHPGLELCLWTGGMIEEQSRLLECIPVKQP